MTAKTWILSTIVLAACWPPKALAQPSIQAVVNAASGEALLAPGSWMTIYGANLAAGAANAARLPLPASLAGATVTVNGAAAPLLYVSPGQINALVPFEVELSKAEEENNCAPAQVVVSTADGSATHALFLNESAPALFTRDMAGRGRALIFSSNFELLDSVAPGQTVVLYAAGLGETDPPAASSGIGASQAPLNQVPAADMPDVFIGSRKARVLFAGLAPGLPGVYQLNVQVPDQLATDRVELKWGVWRSNVAHIGIPQGHNVANATGTITSVYPNNGSYPSLPISTAYGFSIMPHVTRYSASMDILPGAGPFAVVAAGETGTAIIDVDPGQGVWHATLTVPSMEVRNGNFSALAGELMDYTTCRIRGGLECEELQGGVVPFRREDPGMVLSFFMAARPNRPDAGDGTYMVSGTLPADGHFVIDSETIPNLATFGGAVGMPLGYNGTRVAPLRLYIDGHMVALNDVVYPVVNRPR